MKALVYNKEFKNKIEFTERKDPVIKSSSDAIVKVTLSSICTSDLHIIKGFVPRANNDIVLGHEFVGEVVDIGSDVKKIKIGDRVAANCITFCGECYFCKKGFINNCQKGGWELGCKIDGCQAEYVRVPYADMGLSKLPDNVTYENALFVGDILSSGYFGAQMCEIKNGDTVLENGKDYTVEGNVFTLKKEYVATQSGNFRLQAEFAMGSNVALWVMKFDPDNAQEYTWTPDQGMDMWKKMEGDGTFEMTEDGKALHIKGNNLLVNELAPIAANGEIEMTFDILQDPKGYAGGCQQ